MVFDTESTISYKSKFILGRNWLNLELQTLSNLVLPTMLISLGLAVLTVRPYHRIDCSGGEVPKGNIIV